MADLTAKGRNSLPKSSFGLPGERKYPMPDASHAQNAKARASEMYNKGRLSEGAKERIDAKADRVLHSGSSHTKTVEAAESYIKKHHK